MFHSKSGVMFLNSSLICNISSPTAMNLNVHIWDLTIPHTQTIQGGKTRQSRGLWKGPLLLSHATTNGFLGKWTTRWPIWDVTVLLDCEWNLSLTCLLPHIHFNLGKFTHYDDTAYKMCEMSLQSRRRCLRGILHFYLLCSSCSSWINTSDISQPVWLCIATAVCTWET
jgi:hypothetical protein